MVNGFFECGEEWQHFSKNYRILGNFDIGKVCN